MKIVHVLRKYDPDQWGGIESHLLDLTGYLKQQGHTCVIFAPHLRHGRKSVSDPFEEVGVQVHRYHSFLPSVGLTQEQKQQLHALGGNIFSLDLMWKLLNEPDIDILHTHALNRIGGITRRAAQFKKIPFVVSIHGGYTDLSREVSHSMTSEQSGGLDLGKPLGWMVGSRDVPLKADHVFVFNQTEYGALAEKRGAGKVSLLPHAVRCFSEETALQEELEEHFPALVQSSYVLCVSRITPAKQQDLLIQAFSRLKNSHPDLKLVLVGGAEDASYLRQLHTLVVDTSLKDRVLFVGNVSSRSKVLETLYKNAAMFVLPSKHEPLGIVILEAWAAGAPVIATDTSGARELIDQGKTGLICNHSDAELASVMRQLLEDSECRAMISRAGNEQVREHFTVEHMANLYLSTLSRLTI